MLVANAYKGPNMGRTCQFGIILVLAIESEKQANFRNRRPQSFEWYSSIDARAKPDCAKMH